MIEESHARPAQANPVIWVSLLLPTCGAAAYLAYTMGSHSMHGISYLSGQFLVYGAVGAALFYGLLLRKQGGKYYLTVLAALFAAMYAGGSIGVDKQKQQAAIAMTATQEEMQRLTSAIEKANASKDGGMQAHIMETTTSTAPRAQGEYGEMERFMKGFMNSAVSYKNSYLQELQAIGWDRVMDAKRLQADRDMAESKAILARARTIITKFEAETDTLFANGKASIDSLAISDGAKNDMRAGFDKGANNTKNQIMQNWQMEREALQEVENMVKLLADKKKWTVEKDQVMFRKQEDLDKFNTYNGNLEKIGQRQVELQQRQLKKSAAEMQNLKSTLQNK
ncbi:hypothetical protein [Undibacterium pigrum]|uniref:Uncharacterized protein n=1 Tax=Undibacterium pigrum TaxID=401470 RepID=A0A318J1M1_9BURK|nr:hypothetical protein [Undibacterium pigrum]PXX41485.1 hypothetical protein DFR42_107136 [Undibacterium pigrum]